MIENEEEITECREPEAIKIKVTDKLIIHYIKKYVVHERMIFAIANLVGVILMYELFKGNWIWFLLLTYLTLLATSIDFMDKYVKIHKLRNEGLIEAPAYEIHGILNAIIEVVIILFLFWQQQIHLFIAWIVIMALDIVRGKIWSYLAWEWVKKSMMENKSMAQEKSELK